MKIPTPAEQGQALGSVELSKPGGTPQLSSVDVDTSKHFARDLNQLGDAAIQMGSFIADRRDDALLREIELDIMDFERGMYDPDGLLQTEGGSAVGTLNDYATGMEAARKRIEGKIASLSRVTSKEAARKYFQGQDQRLWKTAASHENAQLDVYEKLQTAATIEGTTDLIVKASNDPDAYERGITRIATIAEDEVYEQAGGNKEIIEQHVQSRTTAAALSRAGAMLHSNPEGIEEFIKEEMEIGRVDPQEGQAWLDKNKTVIDNAIAKGIAYGQDDAANAYPNMDPQRGSSIPQFLGRMGFSESGNNPNAKRRNKDGRRFEGELQFGEARLNDAKRAGIVPWNMSLRQAVRNPTVARNLAYWHIQDIDKAIDRLGSAAYGFSRDGLRAVAHLGGKGGMRAFVLSGGRYNKSDELGTSLHDYYAKFARHPKDGGAAFGRGPQGRIDDMLNSGDARQVELGVLAQEALNKRMAAEQRALALQSSEAERQILVAYEQDPSSFNLEALLENNPAMIETLGGEALTRIEKYIADKEAGVEPIDIPDMIEYLENLKVQNPAEFAKLDLGSVEYLTQLAPATQKAYVKEQAEIRGEVTGRTTNKDITDNFGTLIDTQLQGGSNRTYRKAKINQRVKERVNEIEDAEGRRLTPVELSNVVERVLLSEENNVAGIVNPAGMLNQEGGATMTAVGEAIDAVGLSRFLAIDTDFVIRIPSKAGMFEYRPTREERKQVVDDLMFRLQRPPTGTEIAAAFFAKESDLLNP